MYIFFYVDRTSTTKACFFDFRLLKQKCLGNTAAFFLKKVFKEIVRVRMFPYISRYVKGQILDLGS